MLVCADNPLGQKFTPGPDGGIDIFVPDGGRRRKVFQVKNFPTKFNNTEFRQVKKSLNRVASTASTEGWEMTEWYLVTPRDSSPGYRSKIEAVVKSHGIPTWSWMGLTQLDILAANHPQLVDYYLDGGQSRFAEQLADLTAIIRGDTPGTEERLQPTEVGERIRTLQRAANNDPHYRYHFQTSDRPLSANTDEPEPWLVATASERHDPIWLHIKIYAKFLAALQERPITGTININTSGDPELSERFEQFLDFGTGLRIPSGAASADLDLPGNLGRDVDDAEIHIVPISSESEEVTVPLTAGAQDAAGAIVAELPLHRTEETSGVRGGRRTVWTDNAGLITLEIKSRPGEDALAANGQMSWRVHGRPPSEVAGVLTFMDALNSGARLGVSPSYGPRRYNFGTPIQTRPDADLHITARVAKALEVVQQHCTDRLLMPDELTENEMKRLFEAATLLQGEPATATWVPFTFTVDATDEPMPISGSRINVAVTTPLAITMSERTHRVGLVASFLDANVDSVTGNEVTLSPYDVTARATRVLALGEENRVWVASPQNTSGAS